MDPHGAAIVAYLANVSLIAFYLQRRAPGLLERSAQLPADSDGRLLWEYTAGTGLVPKWVSTIGLLAIPAFALGLLLLVWSFIRGH